jgi:hypothetical protein
MITMGKRRSKVIAFKEQRTPLRPRPSKLEHITLLLCGSGSGGHIKPMVILPLKKRPVFSPAVEQFYHIYTGNSSGWMNEESLSWWIENCFYPHIYYLRIEHQNDSPAILILDGHSSRNNLPIRKYLEEYGISILFLPSHASHILQPMDLSVNPAYKHYFGKSFTYDPNLTAHEKRERILSASRLALSHALCLDTVMQGFKLTGIAPFNENLIKNSPYIHQIPVDNIEIKKKRKRAPPPAFIDPNTINNWINRNDVRDEQEI